ncbi:hypothetical protein Tdes44962_MAKER06780 [Teratosphaeria destructans]|uniref:BTB domain-containing protein n=1 Tax=Teratosphaeria destructans TaxID=418781 RepID=A0A9W7T0V1_9PEZI|nr:hypothetical protein Tdes44962_MAKER06780 [Teratosphaeria destructans]
MTAIKKGPPLTAYSWSCRSVILKVGEEEGEILVHESLIRTCSSFFEAALSKPWKESTERTILLPDDEPNIVKLYVQYLYRKQLCIKVVDEHSLKLQNHENHPEFFTLATLYVFGEKIGDIGFKNAVLDAFIQRMNDDTPDGGKRYPVNKVVDIIYRGTMAGSKARQLMLDVHVWRGGSWWITENPEENNKEFLMELSRALMDKRFIPAGATPLALTSIIDGTYHET